MSTIKTIRVPVTVRLPRFESTIRIFEPNETPSIRVVLDFQFLPFGGTGRPRTHNVDQIVALIPDEGALRCEILRSAKAAKLSRSTAGRLLREGLASGQVLRKAGAYFRGASAPVQRAA